MSARPADINGEPTVISLFAGCGGSSLGYKMAGYKELLAVEWDDNAIQTFKLNFDTPIEKWDIQKLSGKRILDYCNIKKGEIDLLDGSPPCQGFSTAGKRKVMDIRNDLVLHNIRLIDEIQPKVFVIENVSGMVKGKMKGLFIQYMKKMKSLNYNVRCKLLNAMYYQVPQSRQRIIFIGVRKDIGREPVFPEPSKKVISVRMAFEGLLISDKEKEKVMVPKSAGIYSYLNRLKEGENQRGNKYFNLVRINRNKPSPTIPKMHGQITIAGVSHFKENRKLTISELKRLHSYPDDFKFIGKFEEQWARIGNSVPPLMMKAIAETIKDEILI